MSDTPPRQPILARLFTDSTPLPAYKTEGAAAFDLSARIRVEIAAGAYARVPLGVALKLPEGYFVLLAVRSSLHTKGLMAANGVGIMDQDYCGDNDEYMAVLYNFTDQPVVVEAGDRIVQAVLLPFEQHPITQVDSLAATSRGGFGTTGTR
jgi:dUTP pyrophosphatase